MDYGLVLFTSDRGISPAAAAKLADDHGFQTFYVPEHTHIPVKREAAHPTTGDASLPDDRYMRTLDPWVSLGAACAVTSRVRLSTAVALPVEHDPITLAKSIATLDHLSGGRVSLGVGFGWNTDELADHGVPPGRRRTMLREYIEAMRALWTQEEAAYDGEFVKFGPSWAWPKPVQPHIPVLVGAAGGGLLSLWLLRERARLGAIAGVAAIAAFCVLAAAGLPILGRYHSVCGGHKLNAAVVSALAADPSAWTEVEASRKRVPGQAGLGVSVAVPAYRAES